MRFVSTYRRHPLAGLVLLVLGLALSGALYTSIAPQSANAETNDPQAIEAGRELFLVGCASCHGVNGEGIDTKAGGNYGPSLIGVGAAAVDFQVATGRMPAAQAGAQIPRKASEYTEEEVAQLAAFVASLGGGPAIPAAEFTDYTLATEEDIVRGGDFFRTNCTACHNSVGAGGALPDGRYAPSLKDVEARHIYSAMLTGPQQMPKFSDEVISPEDKRAIIAYIKTVQEQPSYGGFGGGGLGPVVDGVIVWVVGIGGLVLFTIWIAAHGARVKRKNS